VETVWKPRDQIQAAVIIPPRNTTFGTVLHRFQLFYTAFTAFGVLNGV